MTPTNKDERAFQQWAKEKIAKYARLLLLDRHQVSLVAGNTDFFHCSFRPPYLDNEIVFNKDKVLEAWRNGALDYLEHCLVHEMCHIITDPLYGAATERYITNNSLEQVRETVTDHIATIITKRAKVKE